MSQLKKLSLAKASAKSVRGVAPLLADLRGLILAAREQVARAVDSGLVTLYLHIGRRVHQDILQEKRAEYGAEIVSALGRQLQTGVWSRVQRSKPLPHGAFRRGFPRRTNCVRTADTIGLDAFQDDHPDGG